MEWRYPEKIISCSSLKEKLGNDDVRVFDCTTLLAYTDDHPSKPYDVKSCFSEYEKAHIPTAVYLDLQKDLSDNNSPFGMTLPDLEILAENFQRLGIGTPYHIILYASNGMQWATRIWAMLEAIGFTKVSVLDGGLKEWQRLGFATEAGVNEFQPADFSAQINPNLFIGKERVLSALGRRKQAIRTSWKNTGQYQYSVS